MKGRQALEAYLEALRERLPGAEVREFDAWAGAQFGVRVVADDDDEAAQVAAELATAWYRDHGVSIMPSVSARPEPPQLAKRS